MLHEAVTQFGGDIGAIADTIKTRTA